MIEQTLPIEETRKPRYVCRFSPDRVYRYTLCDTWDEGRPRIMFVGLNPSTADEFALDPTLQRIRQWSNRWGYGSFIMTNLFAFRSPHPKVMQTHEAPVGSWNDDCITRASFGSQTIVAAWGEGGSFRGREGQVLQLFRTLDRELKCLGRTKSGCPIHPMARGKYRVPDCANLQRLTP